MVIFIIPISANATTYSGACGDNVTWIYDSSTYTLTISGTGAMYDYKSNNRPWENYEDKIKTVIINDGVTTIGSFAFYSFGKVDSVTIPESVLEIGNSAFSYCKKLINITIPDIVTVIDESVFSYCESLTNITIPDGVTIIGNDAFAFCESLTNIIIPYGVTTIGNDVFFACNNLTNITIPATVTLIGDGAFQCCENLTEISVDSKNKYYFSDEYGVLFNKNKTILIICPAGNKESFYRIPDSVLTIEPWAFRNCYNLEQVIFPDNVTKIGDHAFYLCRNLVDVKIGNGVTDISDWMFGECDSLVTVTIPDSVTRIGNYAFYWCDNITNVIFGKNVTSIGLAAFNECTNITDIYYPGTINEWNEIAIEDGNEPILEANIHYNYHIHKYNAVVTDPTCTEQGYTTYTCECGDSYIDDYVDVLGHTEETISAVEPTCTEAGLTEGAKCSVCDETLIKQETVSASDHADNDNNGYCDACDELLDPTVECEHNCHKEGLLGFFWRLINFINKIFKTNQYCECGVTHY